MSDIQRDNRVVSLSSRAGIRNSLVTILDQLQRCQKSLNEFLEVRTRSCFSVQILHHYSNIKTCFYWLCLFVFFCRKSALPFHVSILQEMMIFQRFWDKRPTQASSNLTSKNSLQVWILAFFKFLFSLFKFCCVVFPLFCRFLYSFEKQKIVLIIKHYLHVCYVCRHPQCCI